MMTDVDKKFILDELIPFIQRDHGKGFNMNFWVVRQEHDEDAFEEATSLRGKPGCGAVCCIGGSIDFLKFKAGLTDTSLGLNHDQKTVLFYGWLGAGPDCLGGAGWPERYVKDFALACGDPQAEADVACALLREVVATDGAVLNAEVS